MSSVQVYTDRRGQMGLFLNFKVMSLIINTKKSNGHTLTSVSVVCGLH